MQQTFAEYVPWFIKKHETDPILLAKFNVPLDEYIRRCEVSIAGWEFAKAMLKTPDTPVDPQALTAIDGCGGKRK